MRHEKLSGIDGLDARAIASVWPSGAQLAPLPLPDLGSDVEPGARLETAARMSAEAVPDVPASVGFLIVASYVALIAALALATVAPGPSLFAIVISAFFVFMFFAVPAAMLSVRAGAARPATWDRFMHEGLDTHTGRSSGAAALVQMLVVPASLTLGILGMGLAIAFIF